MHSAISLCSILQVEVEDLEVEGSPFWVFFGAPGSLDVDEAAKAAEEAMAAAAASGIATAPSTAPPGSMAAAAQAAATAASSGAPFTLGVMGVGMPTDPLTATMLAAASTAPKVIGSALGSTPIATPASIAAASGGNPLAAAAAAAAAYSVPGAAAAAGLAAANPIAAAMASAAAAAAAGATFVDPFFGNPVHKQLASQLLAVKGVPEIHKNCVVLSRYPFGLDETKIKALMGVAGE